MLRLATWPLSNIASVGAQTVDSFDKEFHVSLFRESKFLSRFPILDGICLTFHLSGDAELARRLFGSLHHLGLQATFFVVGNWLVDNAWTVQATNDAGHELSNHTYSHPALGVLDGDSIRREIVMCRDVLVDMTGTPGGSFRSSGEAIGYREPAPLIMSAASDAGYSYVLGFDVDPKDYLETSAKEIVTKIDNDVQPGSIVSLHSGQPATLRALKDIARILSDRSLKTITTGAAIRQLDQSHVMTNVLTSAND